MQISFMATIMGWLIMNRTFLERVKKAKLVYLAANSAHLLGYSTLVKCLSFEATLFALLLRVFRV